LKTIFDFGLHDIINLKLFNDTIAPNWFIRLKATIKRILEKFKIKDFIEFATSKKIKMKQTFI
jgi:hypothetical protein